MIVRDNKKACNRSCTCLQLRLPPSDLHAQQAPNSPRLWAWTFSLLVLVRWKLAVFSCREQKLKSSISKKYRTETLGLKIEVYHLVLSLYRGKAILGMAQSFCVSFLCNVCFLFTLFLVWQSVNYYNPKMVCRKLWRTILKFWVQN